MFHTSNRFYFGQLSVKQLRRTITAMQRMGDHPIQLPMPLTSTNTLHEQSELIPSPSNALNVASGATQSHLRTPSPNQETPPSLHMKEHGFQSPEYVTCNWQLLHDVMSFDLIRSMEKKVLNS
jgi:hypothetical protein